MKFRVGQGFDAHRFVGLGNAKPLVLGGVVIPQVQGLEGHSDADALTHAICDALLGALALGDIGTHFSDQDPAFANADSQIFLRKISTMVGKEGWQISNVDATVITEQPILRPYIEPMRQMLSQNMSVSVDAVSVKATRPEQMGALGRGQGLVAMANVLLVHGQ